MIKGRKETTPSEQLWELRKARDRYTALADHVRDSSELILADEKLEREREARRIAAAYEKSIENMIARCRSRQIEIDASTSGSAGIGFALLVFFVAVGGAGYFAFVPTATHQVAPQVGARTNDATAAPAIKSPDLSGPSLQSPVSDRGARMAPPPISVLKPKLGVGKRQDIHAIRAAEHTPYAGRPAAVSQTPTPDAGQTAHDDGGFVTKVLQPDGSLMEKYFPAKASR
jgi:hypothetical protein